MYRHTQFPPSAFPSSSWTGWLSPKGEWLPCLYAEHARMAAWALNLTEIEMDDLGWVRCDNINNLRARSAKRWNRVQRRWLDQHGYLVNEEFDGHMYRTSGLPHDWRPDPPGITIGERMQHELIQGQLTDKGKEVLAKLLVSMEQAGVQLDMDEHRFIIELRQLAED